MLENIIKVAKDFQMKYDTEKAKLKAEIVRVQETYKEASHDYVDIMAAARDAFNRSIDAARLIALEEINACVTQAKASLADITSRTAPTDAVTTIELLKAGTPDKTSEFEVKSILGKYKDNYLATKMIVEITDAKKRFGFMCTPADSIVSDIQGVEEMATGFVRQYSGQLSYKQSVLLNGKIVRDVNAKIQNFLNYGYVEELSESMRKAINS